MVRTLFRRLGVVLLAVAFLGGAYPAGAVPQAGAGGMAEHAMHAGQHPQAAPVGPEVPFKLCPHGHDCLSCVTMDLPATLRAVSVLRRTRLSFAVASVSLTGMTPQPELSPPIRTA